MSCKRASGMVLARRRLFSGGTMPIVLATQHERGRRERFQSSMARPVRKRLLLPLDGESPRRRFQVSFQAVRERGRVALAPAWGCHGFILSRENVFAAHFRREVHRAFNTFGRARTLGASIGRAAEDK